MLSFNECKRILNNNGSNYTDEEIKQVQAFLWELAKLELNSLENIDNYEDSCNNEPGQ